MTFSLAAGFILAIGIVLSGGGFALLSLYNLRHMRGWRRVMRLLIALAAGGIAVFYLSVLASNHLNVDPIPPECFRSMLLIMLSVGLAVEISNTPSRRL